ncbi:MAG: hypothetical protein FWE80_05270 [Oscillospiraceae bacterium]|nr:hypothetical protein [Oscillospiraceae bacterium]
MKKQFDFIGKFKIFSIAASGFLLIGLICAIVFGAALSIEFGGGSRIVYAYDAEEKPEISEIWKIASGICGGDVQVSVGSANDEEYTSVITVLSADSLSDSQRGELLAALQEKFADYDLEEFNPDSGIPVLSAFSADTDLLLVKCAAALVISALLVFFLIAFRFRKSGGFSVATAVVSAFALNALAVYCFCVIFRISLSGHTGAAIMAALVYTLIAAMSIFGRIRENRRKLGRSKTITEIVNQSLNETLPQNIHTAVILASIFVVLSIFAIIFNALPLLCFTLPMIFGIVSGFCSVVCLAAPLWVRWLVNKQNKEAEKIKARKKASARR